LVEELYGEIRTFLLYHWKQNIAMKSRYWWATRLCFFGTEHAKGRKEGDLKEFWHFGQYVAKIQNMFEYPENVVVKELPRFNAVGKEAYQMLEKMFMF
jgi:hypothetical protein